MTGPGGCPVVWWIYQAVSHLTMVPLTGLVVQYRLSRLWYSGLIGLVDWSSGPIDLTGCMVRWAGWSVISRPWSPWSSGLTGLADHGLVTYVHIMNLLKQRVPTGIVTTPTWQLWPHLATVPHSPGNCGIISLPNSPQVILGVTNPFFVKSLDHWPHTIRLADSPAADEMLSQRSRSPGEVGGESKPGFHSKYKSFLNRDKTFAKFIASTKVILTIKMREKSCWLKLFKFKSSS